VLAIGPLLAADSHAAPLGEANLPPVAFNVATRIPGPPPVGGVDPRRQPSIRMNDGWACAAFETERGRMHQCWDAGPNPRAFIVPWMQDAIYSARDRWCVHDVRGLTFHCWQRPRRGDNAPGVIPSSWQWGNPHRADWNDAYNRGDRLDDVSMGGTFACLRTTRAQGVFCLGDDRFGQLGSSARPLPQAAAGDPAFVRDVGREVKPALGTWHACALAPARTMDEQTVVCWGRGDYGQLGAPAPDKCTVDGTVVPCARTPVRGPRVKGQMVALGAGDLFTCVTSEDGTRCWGANRDGLFGVRGSCPDSLRRAWPTPDGPVPAPNASCTTTPVLLPGLRGFDPYLKVSPRQICYGGLCLGGVAPPRDSNIGRAVVGPGSDASACAPRGADVVCWGEKYSPPGAPDQPVPVLFEPMPSAGDLAILEGPDAATSVGKANCRMGGGCSEPAKKIPPCEGDNDPGHPVAEILSKTKSLSGGVVRVRGRLGVGPLYDAPYVGDVDMMNKSMHKCDPAVACCKQKWSPVLVGGPDGALSIEHLGCSGDESRACCNAQAWGQTVIASGMLVPEQRYIRTVGWRLVNVSLCVATPAKVPPGPIAFDESSARIRPDAAAALDAIVAYMNEARGVMGVEIAGHAAAYEKRPPALAAARAEAVRRYLLDRGVPAKKIRVEPFGTPSISRCDPSESRCNSRGVDVVIRIGG